jgi:hypothetical protein
MRRTFNEMRTKLLSGHMNVFVAIGNDPFNLTEDERLTLVSLDEIRFSYNIETRMLNVL